MLLFVSCQQPPPLADALTGRWLVLYPDHRLRSRSEREVYARHQDSVVNLFGLKLLELSADGQFVEGDSLFTAPGRWTYDEQDSLLQLQGGAGFRPFRAAAAGFENDTLRLSQSVPLERENIRLTWVWRKLPDDSLTSFLFSPAANAWRKRPLVPESDKALRRRLADLLLYYHRYLLLVSRESAYFLVPRVHLPFRYYQHSVGLRDSLPPAFVSLFHNSGDAQKAAAILGDLVSRRAVSFEWGDNFVLEYAGYFERLSRYLRLEIPEANR